MQKGEQPETGYVIYSTAPMPDDDNNWLLDYQEEGALFSADMHSLYAAECGIAMELKEKVVNQHAAFFTKAENRSKLAAKLSPGMDTTGIERQMTAVVCKSNATCEAFTYALITEANNGETTMLADLKACHLEDCYWQEAETYFGYHAGRNIKDLLIVLFKNDWKRHLAGKQADSPASRQPLTNEALIFMRDWRDSRTTQARKKTTLPPQASRKRLLSPLHQHIDDYRRAKQGRYGIQRDDAAVGRQGAEAVAQQGDGRTHEHRQGEEEAMV